MNLDNAKIAIIGLGYVGLPLAIEFGKQRPVLGFDINTARIQELQSGQDHTLEASPEELAQAAHLSFSSNPADLAACQIFIVTVPTPVDQANRPDLTPLVKASETVGKVLKAGDIVIYESTVYPGATEEICVPVLEKFSGLKYITSSHGLPRFARNDSHLPVIARSRRRRGNPGSHGSPRFARDDGNGLLLRLLPRAHQPR
jgi:UDP-N-acetyl-D-galactosamine dehydrogenase